LDDSKITENGVKVRCSKCKHVFLVKKEAQSEEHDFDSILDGLGSPGEEQEKDSLNFEDKSVAVSQDTNPAEDSEQDLGGFDFGAGKEEDSFFSEEPQKSENISAAGGTMEDEGFSFNEFSFDETPAVSESAVDRETEEPAVQDAGNAFDFSSLEIAPPPEVQQETPVTDPGEFSFDFGADDIKEQPVETPVIKEEFSPDFFAHEELSVDSTQAQKLTDFELETTPGMASTENEPEPEPFSFSMEPDEAASGMPSSLPGSFKEETGKDKPIPAETDAFDFGSLDFGPLTEEAPEKEDSQATPAAGVGTLHSETVVMKSSLLKKEEPSVLAEAEEELPPLSISSRRRGLSIFPIAAIAVLLLVLVVGGFGLYSMKNDAEALNKSGLGFIANWFGIKVTEEGKITIKNPSASFQSNKEVGEIFVVTGEAVSNFKKPRASIHVKVTLFDSKGKPLMNKGAYCGNALSKEQLATLPMAKLEESMNNQFGDSLTNLSVKPGKGIPFVVIFANVPKDAVDYSVEVTGSTVAGQ
jgi:hypothetical protein